MSPERPDKTISLCACSKCWPPTIDPEAETVEIRISPIDLAYLAGFCRTAKNTYTRDAAKAIAQFDDEEAMKSLVLAKAAREIYKKLNSYVTPDMVRALEKWAEK